MTWKRFLAAGLLAAAGVALLPFGIARTVAYAVIGLVGVLGVVAGVRRNRPPAPHAWYLLAVGCGTWLVGDAVYAYVSQAGPAIPFPSLADAFYLLAYPMIASALLMIDGRGRARRSVTALLDTAVLVSCVGMLAWVFLITPTWTASTGPLLERLVSAGYPVGDLLLIAVLIGRGVARRRWNPPMRLLATALGLLVLTDTLYEVAPFAPGGAAGLPALGSGWLFAFVIFGSAALHPSMGVRLVSRGDPETVIPRGQLVAHTVGCLAMPGILIFELMTGRPLTVWPLVLLALPLIVLTFVRIGRMFGELQRRSDSQKLLAHTDEVTGLSNRRRLFERLEEMLADRRAGVVLTLVDLERFRAINDTLGYRTGDSLLVAVAGRLLDTTGPDDVVARLGGATFAVLTTTTRSTVDDAAAAAGLQAALELAYQLPDHLVVSVEVAVGVARVPVVGDAPGTVVTASLSLGRADVALTAATTRPGRVACYTAEMGTDTARATELTDELTVALERGEIVLHYQPQLELATGRVVGVEALARWQHPTRGLLAPAVFLPSVEQTNLIGPFTTYVLDRAIAQGAAWLAGGLRLTVSVNVSARNLLDPGLVDDVRAALARHDYPAAALELEVTESSSMVDPRRSLEVLAALAGLGVRLAVDDYGTGHSSLSYLGHLPFRTLKIDRTFVTNLTSDRTSAAIVRSTIELARQLNLTVIAEGAEDDLAILALRDLGCYAVQGFGVARPVPAAGLPSVVDLVQSRLPVLLGVGGDRGDGRGRAERRAELV